MVPCHMWKRAERYTGKWWFEAKLPKLGLTPRIRIIVEVEEGWTTGMPSAGRGSEPVMDWRLASRPATTKEVFMLQHPSAPTFQYAPPTAVTP